MTDLAGFGALLLILGSAALWFRAAFAVQLPQKRSAYVASWVVGTVLALWSLSTSPSWPVGIAAGLALLVGVFLLFTVAISRQVLAPQAIVPGQTIPEFVSVTDIGKPFHSSSLAGQPILIKFFRGHW